MSDLPRSTHARVQGWRPIRGRTLLDVMMAVSGFIAWLAVAGLAFPSITAALVPFRLLFLRRNWSRDFFRFLILWAYDDWAPQSVESVEHDERSCTVEELPAIPSTSDVKSNLLVLAYVSHDLAPQDENTYKHKPCFAWDSFFSFAQSPKSYSKRFGQMMSRRAWHWRERGLLAQVLIYTGSIGGTTDDDSGRIFSRASVFYV